MRALGVVQSLVLLVACGGGDAVETGVIEAVVEDTAGVEEAPGVCERTLAPGGEVVGERSCEDGRCLVPAWPFVMGAADAAAPDRCPEREVSLSAFAVDQTEVTVERWSRCEADGACEALPLCQSEAEVEDGSQLPVVCATWQQAVDFCAWAGGRLPTEAEWEKAARGEDAPTWPWGATPPGCFTANFRFVSGYCEGGPVEVGRYEAPDLSTTTVADTRSAYGLLDVTGNVWEWTADWYDAGWYRDAPEEDPGSPESCRLDPEGEPGECRYRAMRGGAFNSSEDTTHTAVRSFADPAIYDVNIGFRCAYEP